MGKGSKILYWAGAGAASLLILLVGLAVIVPRVGDSVWLKEIIQSGVADQINGDFGFQKAELAILPSPALSLHQVSLAVPDTAQINLDTIKVYPKLLPLLTGNIELDKIVIDKPDFSLPLPKKLEKTPDQEKAFSLSETLEIASTKLSPILSAIPGLEVGVHKGILRLIDGDEQVFLFKNIEGTFDVSTKSLTTSISSTSNIWESMELQAEFTPGSRKGRGNIFLKNMNGKVPADYFLTDTPPFLDASFSSLQINFTVNPKDGLKANIKSSGSSFTALHEDKEITAKIENLKGNFHHTDHLSTITVEDLTLSNPKIQLNGSFNFDRTIPHAGLDIKSQNADITGVHEVLPAFIAALFGDLPIVQEIFDITRGGTVTQATFQVEGKSLEDLAEFESMLIQGHINNSDISLADLGLNLQGVTGDVTIAQGILEGNNLLARLGNTTGKNGSLQLGLVQKEATPFHLDLELNVDLSEVPAILKQLLPDENIQYFLSLFENVEGTSQVRLTLGESLESLSARVEVNKIAAQVSFKPIPYPITLNGGRILYDGLKAQTYGLQGKIGKSTFTNFSSSQNWEDEPIVEVQSGTFHLVLDETYPWISSYDKLAEELKDIKNITGLAEITVKTIKGPLLKPADLQFELQGSLKNVTLTAETLPGPLKIGSGQVNIIPNKTVFQDLHADLLDSSIVFSGVLQDYINGKINAEVIITSAVIGDDVNTWFVEEIKVPNEYQFRTPLLISRANLQWTSEELFDLQGDFSIKNGPIFSIDIMLNPDELALRHLALKNGDDQAFIKLDLKNRKIGAEFHGSLLQKTIAEIMLHRDTFPDAWVKGDIKFFIDMDSLATSAATGKLDGGNFVIPLKLDKPLLLDSFSLSASDKTITLNSAEADFENEKYSLNGQASLAQERLSMAFDVKTDTIELDKILEALQGEEEVKEEEKREEEEKKIGKSWDLALDATINLHADSLQYNGYTWEPFESQITFANSYLGIEIIKAELCNISTPGKVSFHEGRLTLDFTMEAVDQEFNEILICLEGGEQQMTGTLDLKINISGQGTKDTLVNSLQGNLQFSAKDGFIYQDARAAKLLSFLNVTNMFKGKIPDLRTTGFHYDYLIVKGAMENGVLAISPAKLEAPIMEIVSHGTIHIPREKVYLQVLVAPLQTLNKIQKLLPIIRKIFPSSLVAVPVEVSGDFSDIRVRAMSMSAISTRAFGIMVDALSAPVRVLEGTSGEEK